MDLPKGDLLAFLVVCLAAVFFAEMQVRQVASLRWVCLALVYLTVMAMTIWLYSGG
jgi:cytosine/uracil/thiamine/allantoin permease